MGCDGGSTVFFFFLGFGLIAMMLQIDQCLL